MILALDLEGTLISNAMSQFPRHGLWHFLELCNTHLPRTVLYTTVREPLARAIGHTLVQEGSAPLWFSSIEYIEWSGAYKDLNFIKGYPEQRTLLVDDNRDYIDPEQLHDWLLIDEFAYPYAEDHELQRVWAEICQRFQIDAEW